MSTPIIDDAAKVFATPKAYTDETKFHEPRDAGARVDGGEDEDRLEHDREVIPERSQRVAAEDVEHLGHSDGESGCAAGARHDRLLADFLRPTADVRGIDRGTG